MINVAIVKLKKYPKTQGIRFFCRNPPRELTLCQRLKPLNYNSAYTKQLLIIQMNELANLILPLITLAKQASGAILRIYQQSQPYLVQTKTDHSPLTQADLAANAILVSGLQSLTPDIPILSEEDGNIAWNERQQWRRHWLIDPLDGTLPFIQHVDEFSINIALIEDHQPILGLIYIPVTQECYYGYRQAGAYKIDRNQQVKQIRVRDWQSDQTLILASKGVDEGHLKQRFARLGHYELIRLSSAWKFCRLAEGSADLSPRFGDTSEWDTAAGQCILEEAGGAIFDLTGKPLRYNQKNSLLNTYFIALGDVTNLYPLLPWGQWPLYPLDLKKLG